MSLCRGLRNGNRRRKEDAMSKWIWQQIKRAVNSLIESNGRYYTGDNWAHPYGTYDGGDIGGDGS